MAEELLRLKHACKVYGDNTVLDDVSLTVEEGQVVGVIGPSGGGKSTLLRCCTLLEHLTGGSLIIGDICVARDVDGKAVYESKDVLAKARSRFGLVFQNFNLFPHYTVLKNVSDAPICVQGRPREEAEADALELLEKMGLADKKDMVPCELSGGQQQRVAIARALAMDPDILFFDEPTSALDPELTREVLAVIRALADLHMTMVIVTHEMRFARDVSDHIAFLDGGHIVEFGEATQVIEDPREERTRTFLANYSD